ncbi:sporulation integral membrane protein YlbJ [Carboxydocella sp. JDF658]|uniref:sporulation integral membrane protein YlbJ n=1 Tax=Carboxydocella sp. JDF658 TaxID=1926600 RepID=UPI0009AD8CD2|nr:sporulation integral membrane protein YlbJ [Carboxydocella sp. JDF658]GAW32519.1 sporulation integral membrane protein YlbJ [Carboxydocella sp. JDF658]
MNREKQKLHQGYFILICSLLLVVSLAISPKVAFQGALRGTRAWFEIVLPALLPFFIGSALLERYGLTHCLGVLLEPVMRPLFNLPGAAAFVLAVGYTSGYPIGAVITASEIKAGRLTPAEGQRLLAFTNNASPLFMLGAVAVGMLGQPALGWTLAAGHYAANLTLGILLAWRSRQHSSRPPLKAGNHKIWAAALQELRQKLLANERPLGSHLAEAVGEACNKLLAIGGFIIVFATISQLLLHFGLLGALARLLDWPFQLLGLPEGIGLALGTGLLEITLGCQQASISDLPLQAKVLTIAAILAWSGFSVIAQVASFISSTSLRLLPFIKARLVHILLAIPYTYFFYQLGWSIPTAAWPLPQAANASWLGLLVYSGQLFLFTLLVLTLLAIISSLLHRLKS